MISPPGSPALNRFDSAAVCGDQTAEAYSNFGLMRVLYAVDFSSCLCGLIFLLRKIKDWFAFFCNIGFMCSPAKVVQNGDPRYLAADTLSSSML